MSQLPRHLSACLLAAAAAHAVLLAVVVFGPASASTPDTLPLVCLSFLPSPAEPVAKPVNETATGKKPLPMLAPSVVTKQQLPVEIVTAPAPALAETTTAAPALKPTPVPTLALSSALGLSATIFASDTIGFVPSGVTASTEPAIGGTAPSGVSGSGVSGAISHGVEVTPELTQARPAYRSNPPPRYPDTASRRRQEGMVLLRVAVSAAGEPERVALEQSSGHALLDDSALAAVRRWRFEPARLGPVAVASQVQVPVRFRLAE